MPRDPTQPLEVPQDSPPLGEWTCELATGVLLWSPQLYRLFGRAPGLSPPSLGEMMDMLREGPQPTATAFERALATNEAQMFEASATIPCGGVVQLHVIVLPVCDEAGHVTGMRGTIQDITARKALEQQLFSAKEAADATNRAKGAFLATMSHEIRTPLNAMLGLLELISLTPVNPEIGTSLQAVRDSGLSLQRIIDDILDFSKVEAGKLEIFSEPTRLLDLVDSVHRIYSGSAKTRGLDFQRHVDPQISPVLMLDALRLRQILSNFVSNAIKFTPQGSVELRVMSEGRDGALEHMQFEVVDTGIGISSAEQRKLFQPYEQAHSNAGRFGGTGLGLSIARRLAELMGGQVNMTSEFGAGTTVTLQITAAIADPAVGQSMEEDEVASHWQHLGETPPSAWASDPQRLILVVDDHPTNRMVMHSQIKALGYAAEAVESAAVALERWRTGKFALVLTDCNMPGMSGYDLSRRIREAEASGGGPRTPIIACSANVIPGVMQDCLDAGMDDYMAKPIRLQVLSEKLAHWSPVTTRLPGANTSVPELAADHVVAVTGGIAEPESRPLPAGGKNEYRVTSRALAHFRQVNDVDVASLLEAIERSDMEGITRMAHRIKGACGFIGATGLASVCAMIEQSGREEDAPGVAWVMDAFHKELEQLNADLAP